MAQVSAQKCSLCDESNGAYYCYECQHALCTVCRKRHGKIPALSAHTVADINTINLSTVNKTKFCDTHNKDIQFYCTECSNLICSKCVTSTHKSHTISDITDVVLEEREKAKDNIKELKSKTEAISSLQEKIRREHIEKLHVESTKCIGHIESVCKDLQSFLEAKGSIKTTEVEDNENLENQNFEAFFKNTGLVHKQYVHILSELENLLLEKHDITFFSGYRSIQSDIETLVSIPDEPPFAQVPSFEDESLYREVMEHIESKMDKSLCQNCSVQVARHKELHLEYQRSKETLQRDLELKGDQIKKLSEDMKDEQTKMQSEYTSVIYMKDTEIKKMSDNIKSLQKEIEQNHAELEQRNTELKGLQQEIQTLKTETETLRSSSSKPVAASGSR
ncbi:probable RING finger protein 207 homolog [Mytilus edulis]|uniref:probable RING finger protein 207 homolog n=1 Tax=Mytilus edulis TaxID=6550 RepID=UPI0039EE1BD2